jgi:hypothetical protein
MKHRWLYAFTALLIGVQGSASAQVWPVKPIRVIVPRLELVAYHACWSLRALRWICYPAPNICLLLP